MTRYVVSITSPHGHVTHTVPFDHKHAQRFIEHAALDLRALGWKFRLAPYTPRRPKKK